MGSGGGATYAIVVFQHRPLEDEEPSLPATKIFPAFGEVAFFMPNLHHGLLLLPDNIRCEKGNDLVVVLYRQSDQ